MSGMMNHIGGLKIIINNCVDEKTMVPKKRHRRPRIQKKWSKRFGNRTIITPNIYRMNAHVIMSESSLAQLRRMMEAKR